MNMLANGTETRALTLADYEARIHLYKEQIGTGYIGIGRTLLEAKEAKVVPHGQWESWVTETTGLTPRQAQRCMQAATEIRDGSAMARLEMSKALMLLGSGLDEEAREEIAEKAGQEGATVKALREEIRQAKLKLVQETGAAVEIREALKKAEEERDQIEQQMRETISGYKSRLDEETAKAYQQGQDDVVNMNQELQHTINMKAMEIKQLRADLEENKRLRQSLQDRLDSAMRRADDQNAAGRQMMLERDGLRNELNKQKQYAGELERMLEEKDEETQRMLRQCDEEARAEEREKLAAAGPADYAKDREILLAAAADAEKRAAEAEAELEALRAGGAEQPDPVWKVLKLAVDRFMTDCEAMPLNPAALIGDERRIRANVNWIGSWVDMMRKALETAVPAEGAVE